MHTIGTAHFVSRFSAYRYYGKYGFDRHDVDNKIESGEIRLGKPEIKPIETLFIREGRYHIQVGY